MEFRHVSRVLAADPQLVQEFARDPQNLPAWASGLAQSPTWVENGVLRAESPMGVVSARFAPPNEFGVLDHDVELPDGSVVTNCFRVLPHPDGAELLFTVRQLGLTDEEFARDCRTVAEDLDRLAALVEERPRMSS